MQSILFISKSHVTVKSWSTKNLRGRLADTVPSPVPIFWHRAEIRSKAMTLRLVTAWNQFLIGRTRSVSHVPRVLRCRITWMGRRIGPSTGYRLETRQWLAQSNYLQAYRESMPDNLNLTRETSYNFFNSVKPYFCKNITVLLHI